MTKIGRVILLLRRLTKSSYFAYRQEWRKSFNFPMNDTKILSSNIQQNVKNVSSLSKNSLISNNRNHRKILFYLLTFYAFYRIIKTIMRNNGKYLSNCIIKIILWRFDILLEVDKMIMKSISWKSTKRTSSWDGEVKVEWSEKVLGFTTSFEYINK